jgi:hypothetical protein
MKKYFRFLSLVTIIAIVASVSVIAPLTANAGSLTNLRVSLSSYDISADGAEVNVNMTTQATLATELSGTAGDKIYITFNEYEGLEEDQFNVGAVVVGDVVVSCDGDANVMDDASVSVEDGAGTASDVISIVLGDATSIDTCAIGGVLKIVISNNRIRTPYTVDNVSPSGYRIKFETTDTTDVVEDTGTVAIFINDVGANQVLIYGTVDPVLTLSVLPNACDLGVLSKDNFRTCAYTVTVGTNADLGYGAYIKSDGELNDDVSLAVIQKESVGNPGNGPGTANAIDNDALLAETEYGMGVYSATETLDVYPAYRTPGWAGCDNIEASLDYDVPAEDISSVTAQRFAYSNDPVDASTTGITELCHVARISGDQPSGSFTQTVTITVVGNF